MTMLDGDADGTMRLTLDADAAAGDVFSRSGLTGETQRAIGFLT